MPDYVVFGGCLRSELGFPELVEVRGRVPNWTLRLGVLDPDDGFELISDERLSSTCRVRLTRRRGSYRYSHSCTGNFEVSPDGRDILFEPAAGAALDVARTDFVARVLLLCVDYAGVTWLHGSAVAFGTRAVALLGPSGAGKSTLALALARAGAEHICDDTLPVEAGVPPMVWPSDHTIRLRADTKGMLATNASAIRRETDGKYVLTHDMLSRAPRASSSAAPRDPTRTQLDTVYLLRPERVGDAERRVLPAAATRRRLAATSAVPELMRHVKLGPVVGAEAPERMMRQLAAIASTVPVYELRLKHDWSLVDQVVEQMLAWHPLGEAGRSNHANASEVVA